MTFSMRALRMGLAGGALLLLLVVAGFISYAHYRAQRFLLGLPGKLGINITQETNNFTYSQSLQGKTVFTVHASKEIQRKDGRITLHDVGIVLYGRKADRADRIHGNEFEYDQKNGVLRAVGEAFIDLSAPAAGSGTSKPVAGSTFDDPQMIHVKTNGLVFLQKERSATTDGALEFAASGLTGKAVGATYDAGTGVVILRSAVQVSGLRGEPGKERPLVLTASRAEMDRVGNVVLLASPRYLSTASAGAQTISAEHARVHLAEGGAPQSVQAEGGVVLEQVDRGRVTADRLDAELNAAGQPRSGHLYGGVHLVQDGPARHLEGQAADARVAFDAVGRPVHAWLAGAVKMNDRAGLSERKLDAERAEVEFGGGGKRRSFLTGATAMGAGGARLEIIAPGTGNRTGAGPASGPDKAAGPASTVIRANTLKARFEGGESGRMSGLDGTGRTMVERVALDAHGTVDSKDTSTGDILTMDFKTGPNGRAELVRAVQRGSVETQRELAGKPGSAPAVEHARSDAAVYEAASDRLLLTGAVQLSDVTSALFAERVVLERSSGDAVAEGSLKVSYSQASGPGTKAAAGAEPVHVVAQKAVSRKATGVTEFTAAAGSRVRMWQGGSQIEAPVLDLNRTAKTMVAQGGNAAGPPAVKALLAGSSGGAKGSNRTEDAPVRVVSRRMTYTDADRQATFSGSVQVEDRDGLMRASEATVFLAPSAGPAAGTGVAGAGASGTSPAGLNGAGPQGLLGGRVERVMADGAVELEQPGRKATGEKVIYDASDGTYVLTGSRAVPPRLTDDARGTITGSSLRFRSGDDSVVISGGEPGEGPGRVRSEPRVRQ